MNHYTNVAYCGTPQDLCWCLYLHTLDLCVLICRTSRGLSTDVHELGLINVNPQVLILICVAM